MKTRFLVSLFLVLSLQTAWNSAPRANAATLSSSSREVWPNPFTDGTTFQLTMPSPGVIKIAVYDISGRLIRTLHDGYHEAGNYDIYWNGKDLNDNPVPAGVYVCTLFSDNTVVKSVKVVKINK